MPLQTCHHNQHHQSADFLSLQPSKLLSHLCLQPKEMNLSEALDSTDAETVLKASHTIRHEWDRSALQSLADVANRLEHRISKLNFGGTLRPNRTYVEAALNRIRLAATCNCLCDSYLSDEMYDPDREASEGRIRLLSRVANYEKQAYEFICECVLCGSQFAVEERQYHYSWWQWSRTSKTIHLTAGDTPDSI